MRHLFLYSLLLCTGWLHAQPTKEQRDNQYLLSFLEKTINGTEIPVQEIRNQLANLEADINETVQNLESSLKRLLPNWPQKFATLKQRIEKLQPFLSRYGERYVAESPLSRSLILSMIGIKPATTDDDGEYEKIERMYPQADAPHNFIKNGSNWKIISLVKTVASRRGDILMRLWVSSDALFPLDFVYENYKDKIKVTEAFKKKYVHDTSGPSRISIEEFQAVTDHDTSDAKALIYGHQPLIFDRVLQTEWQRHNPLLDLSQNKHNFRYLIQLGRLDYSDSSPYMQLYSKVCEYFWISTIGVKGYLQLFAKKLQKEIAWSIRLKQNTEVLAKLKDLSPLRALAVVVTDLVGPGRAASSSRKHVAIGRHA